MQEVTRKALGTRLNRVEGRVRRLLRMIEEDRYCADTLTQISAVRSALHKVEEEILKDHVAHCVAGGCAARDVVDQRHKVEEPIEAIGRMAR
jgi:CsoR family transcriptional regulator, copper-sensing transcriptional repressor